MPVFFSGFFLLPIFSQSFFLSCQFLTWSSWFPVSWAPVIFLRCHFSFLTFLLPIFGASLFYGATFSLGVFSFRLFRSQSILKMSLFFTCFAYDYRQKKLTCSAHLGGRHRKNVQKAQLFPFGNLLPEKNQFQIFRLQNRRWDRLDLFLNTKED